MNIKSLLAMFSSDIELDFDDDFPFDTFCNKLTTDKGDALQRGRVPGPPLNSPNKLTTDKGDALNSPRRGPSPPPTHPSKGESSTRTGFASGKESSLKRGQVQDERPQKKRLSHEGLPQRKFPGPAGLLPDKPFKQLSDSPLPIDTLIPDHTHPQHHNPPLFSQSSASAFLHPAYHQLLNDFSLNDPANPLNHYTVEWLKRTALSKGLQGRKVPFLGLVVHAVNHSMPDPVLLLRDPTGEITGSLHREVWAEMGPKLRPGIALALRQVGVLITGVIRRQIYLNITMNNILAVYRAEGGEGVDVTRVNRVSHSELLREVERSRRAPMRPPSLGAGAGAGALFSSVEGASGSCGKEELGEWGMVLGEEMRVGEGGGVGFGGGLSSEESMILEEVLSGIDPDEFDT